MPNSLARAGSACAAPTAGWPATTILSAAQAEEIEKFRGEVLQTRKELRQVQHALRRDIDQIETRLQFVMIGAVPLVIAIFAIVFGFVRRFRRRRHTVVQG